MAKQQLKDVNVVNDEFTRIFDAYRAKIDEITRRTQRNLSIENRAEEPEKEPVKEPVKDSMMEMEGIASSTWEAPDSSIARVTPRQLHKEGTPQVTPPPENEEDIVSVSTPTEDIDDEQADSPQMADVQEEAVVSIPSEIEADPPLPEDKLDTAAETSPPEDKHDDPEDSPETADIQDKPVFSIPSVKKPESFTSPVRVEIPVIRESDVIIKEAKRKARYIIAEAEDIIKKEAKKKTQTHVNKILDDAREEAEGIISKATHDADRERAVATLTLNEEKERVIKDITEKYTQESRQRASQIIEDAKEKSAAIMNEIIASSEEIRRQINEIINRAKNTLSEFEMKLQAENEELAKAISEVQSKLMQLTVTPVKENPEPAEDADTTLVHSRESGKNPSMSVHLTSDSSRDKSPGSGLFSGHLQMKTASASFDYQYLKNLKKYLVHIPNIKYVQESASEREISVQFDVKEPLPLIDILNRIPIIDEVISETDEDMCLIFKSTE